MNTALKYLLLCVLIFLSFFYGAGSSPLFDSTEGAFAQSSVEMLSNKDWLTPYLNGRPVFDNPPLVHWLQAFCINIFGINELAFRLPSMLGACFWMAIIYLFVKSNKNEEMAYNTVFIACSSVIVSVFAKLAVADIILNIFLSASLFSIYYYFTTGKKRFIYIAFMTAGLGALTKGPIAAFVPFVVSILFFLSTGQLKKWMKGFFSPVGIIIITIIALPWYLVEYIRYGDLFIEGFLIKNNPADFTGTTIGEGGGFAYYIPVLLAGLLPATSLLFSVLKRLLPLWNDLFSRFMLIWFFSVFIFFALSGTKLPHLILNGMTPLFILCAYVFNTHRKKYLLALPVLIFFTLLFSLPFIIASMAAKASTLSSAEMLLEAASRMDLYFLAPIGIMFLILSILMLFHSVSYRTFAGLLAIFTLVVLNVIFIPLVAEVKQRPVKEAALFAKENNKKVNLWAQRIPSFNVYYGEATEKKLPEEEGLVFIESDKAGLADRPFITVKEWAGYRLIQVAKEADKF